MKAYRHGDLALVIVEEIPEGLKPSESKILMTGSGGNDHRFDNGTFYPATNGDRSTLGYLKVSGNTKLYHPDHGEGIPGKPLLRECVLPEGLYKALKQQEYTHEGMRPVID